MKYGVEMDSGSGIKTLRVGEGGVTFKEIHRMEIAKAYFKRAD
jgi:hypothetical protein